MQYRKLGNTGKKVSALGFGCMRLPTEQLGDPKIDTEKAVALIRKGIDAGINYVDTAFPYHKGESEIVLGLALKDGYREKVMLATKIPVGMPEFSETVHYDDYLDKQLKKLDVDYLDFYLFHGINEKVFKEKVLGLNLIEKAQAAKKSGKIKHIAFSFHDKPEVLKEIIDTGHFDLMLVQYNIVDQVNEEMITYAGEKGMAVAIMGPVGGGRLAGNPPESMQGWLSEGKSTFVDLALKFVLSNPNVSVALSGMGSDEMLEGNLALTSKDDYTIITDDEKGRVQKIADKFKELSDNICTGCGYCMPCPNEVSIKNIFNYMVRYQIYGREEDAKSFYSQIGKVRWSPGKDATACIECGECLEKCPQNIPIIDQLKEAHILLG